MQCKGSWSHLYLGWNSLPSTSVGWVADKRVPRHLVLRAAGVTSLLAAAATLHALSSPTAVRFHLLCVSLALWGVAQVRGGLRVQLVDNALAKRKLRLLAAAQLAAIPRHSARWPA